MIQARHVDPASQRRFPTLTWHFLRRWFRELSIVLFCLVPVIMPQQAHAQTRNVGGETDTGQSIIIRLQRDGDDLRSTVTRGLQPRLDSIRKTLRDAVAETRSALETWKRERTEAAAMDYENAVSAYLIAATQGLQEVIGGREAVLNSAEALKESVAEARSFYGKRAGEYRRQSLDGKAQAGEMRAALKKLARSFAGTIESGQNLPPEVDLKVREIYESLRFVELRGEMMERAGGQLSRFVAELQRYDGLVRRLKGEYELIFRRAETHQALVRDVAAIRGDELQVRKLLRELAWADREFMKARGTLDEVLGSIQEMTW
ncbi:MAG: hypothetical protein GF355_08555, partial [Candidatus Eisenbacteria bacterium]|nr:hypothetical protein [Candidatus Eisenbacteria bacterium]